MGQDLERDLEVRLLIFGPKHMNLKTLPIGGVFLFNYSVFLGHKPKLMEILLNLHSYLAYIVLAVLLLAVVNALLGWVGKKDFSLNKDLRISLFALIFSHIQLLVGLILYFVSAKGLNAIQVLGMGGMDSASRLLALEHPLMNVLALVLITIGWSRHKKVMESTKKFKTIAIFYGLGLVLILSRLPWGQWFA